MRVGTLRRQPALQSGRPAPRREGRHNCRFLRQGGRRNGHRLPGEDGLFRDGWRVRVGRGHRSRRCIGDRSGHIGVEIGRLGWERAWDRRLRRIGRRLHRGDGRGPYGLGLLARRRGGFRRQVARAADGRTASRHRHPVGKLERATGEEGLDRKGGLGGILAVGRRAGRRDEGHRREAVRGQERFGLGQRLLRNGADHGGPVRQVVPVEGELLHRVGRAPVEGAAHGAETLHRLDRQVLQHRVEKLVARQDGPDRDRPVALGRLAQRGDPGVHVAT